MTKYNKISKTLLLGCCILLAGCEKIVEFKGDDVTPYVVLISKPQADSLVQLRLTYSRFFLDGHPLRTISNADVSLYSNGNRMLLLSADSGNYCFDCRPKPGDSLEFKVMVPGYSLVQAGTRVPAEPDFEVLETAFDTINRICQVKVRINDPKGRNYYRISFEGWTKNYYNPSDTDTTPNYALLFYSTDDIVFTDATSVDFLLEQGETSAYGTNLSFSDALFDGKTHTMTFNMSLGGYGSVNYVFDTVRYPFYVRLTALSYDRYRYDYTLKQKDNEFELFSEPTQIHTNVQGGIGVFAASTIRRIQMKPVFKRIQ